MSASYVLKIWRRCLIFHFYEEPSKPSTEKRDYCFYVPSDKLFEPCTIERKILKLERFEEKKKTH